MKNRKILILLLFFTMNSKFSNSQTERVFSSDFDTGLSKKWRQQKAADDRIQNVYDKDLRKKVLKVTVNPKDIVVNHNRAELNLVDDSIVGLGDRIYSWKFKIPTDSIEKFAVGKWRVIGQWHDNPDRGMSWAEYNKKFGGAHPPPIAIELFQKNDKWMIGIRYGLEYGKQSNDTSSRRIVAKGEILPNQWNSIEVHIHWSQNDDGYIEAKLNGDVITPFNGTNHLVYGRNLFNNVPNAFKIGIYRAFGFKTSDIMYYSDITITKAPNKALFNE